MEHFHTVLEVFWGLFNTVLEVFGGLFYRVFFYLFLLVCISYLLVFPFFRSGDDIPYAPIFCLLHFRTSRGATSSSEKAVKNFRKNKEKLTKT